jgi:hypothetical protein
MGPALVSHNATQIKEYRENAAVLMVAAAYDFYTKLPVATAKISAR